MRASLGFRAGPLYVGTGNLLKTKRRGPKRGPSGAEIIVYLIVAPFVLAYFAGYLLWQLSAASWRTGSRAVARRRAAKATAHHQPADDPAWTYRGQ